jgi:hypothetical protein
MRIYYEQFNQLKSFLPKFKKLAKFLDPNEIYDPQALAEICVQAGIVKPDKGAVAGRLFFRLALIYKDHRSSGHRQSGQWWLGALWHHTAIDPWGADTIIAAMLDLGWMKSLMTPTVHLSGDFIAESTHYLVLHVVCRAWIACIEPDRLYTHDALADLGRNKEIISTHQRDELCLFFLLLRKRYPTQYAELDPDQHDPIKGDQWIAMLIHLFFVDHHRPFVFTTFMSSLGWLREKSTILSQQLDAIGKALEDDESDLAQKLSLIFETLPFEELYTPAHFTNAVFAMNLLGDDKKPFFELLPRVLQFTGRIDEANKAIHPDGEVGKVPAWYGANWMVILWNACMETTHFVKQLRLIGWTDEEGE